tara:strand:- start:299 stop:535 length:237 start_codon:yes stop_codon:yes gene_type:complete
LKQSNSLKSNKLSDEELNKKNEHLNRGVELLLNSGFKPKPHPIHIIFQKIICCFKREIKINFEFSLNIKKLNSKKEAS